VAKSRAQRKAEQRKRQARQQQRTDGQSAAQHRTQVPESADVAEAELAEQGANLDELTGTPAEPEAPAPSRGETAPARAAAATPADAPAEAPAEAQPPADKITRREQKRQERERKQAARASVERRKPREEPVERERGRVMGFLASCVAELRRVQWPTRDTLIQASAVTLVFITVAAAYLGVLDGAFNWLVQRIL
jgi:preprotein translocase SecE subunit